VSSPASSIGERAGEISPQIEHPVRPKPSHRPAIPGPEEPAIAARPPGGHTVKENTIR